MKELNKEILEKVAVWLEAGAPHEQSRGMGFHMAWTGTESRIVFSSENGPQPWISPSCGTVGCIAGAIVQFTHCTLNYDDVIYVANSIVGGNTNSDGTHSLFYPEDLFHEDGREGYYATPQEAAIAVRHFMEHQNGEAAWAAAGFTRKY